MDPVVSLKINRNEAKWSPRFSWVQLSSVGNSVKRIRMQKSNRKMISNHNSSLLFIESLLFHDPAAVTTHTDRHSRACTVHIHQPAIHWTDDAAHVQWFEPTLDFFLHPFQFHMCILLRLRCLKCIVGHARLNMVWSNSNPCTCEESERTMDPSSKHNSIRQTI